MPFTIEQQDEILRKNGLDPAKHFMDLQTGEVYKKPVSQEAPPNFDPPSTQELITNPEEKPKMSMAEAASTTLLNSIIPTGGGLAGGAIGARGGALLGGSMGAKLGPWGAGIGGLAGGVLGAIGADKYIQQPFQTDEWKAKVQEADKEFPITSGVARFVPSLVALNPAKSIR